MGARPIAIRLEQRIIDEIDVIVTDDETLASRTEFIKQAIADAIERTRQRRIDRQIIEAYERMPETEEELAETDAATAEWLDDLGEEDW